MGEIVFSRVARLARDVRGSLRAGAGVTAYHEQLLEGLRGLVGCDGAAFRPGARWAGSPAYYLDDDTRFTDGYVRAADTYRPEVLAWCDLAQGDRAFIDTEIYSAAERRKKGLYADVIRPAGVRSIMGCPLNVDRQVVGLVLLYRTGKARPFSPDQARALDPILHALALAEAALGSPTATADAYTALDALPQRLRGVFRQLLTGNARKRSPWPRT